LKLIQRAKVQASTARPCVRFAVFEIDLDSGELRKRGMRIKLQQKAFEILALLIERHGEVVTRQELQRLWPSDVVVDFESCLNNAVKKLRAALGDSAETPRFIETVVRHGCRFLVSPEKPLPRIVINSASANCSGHELE